MMGGTTYGAADALVEIAAQLDYVLALAQCQGIFFLVTQLAQMLDFRFEGLYVVSQILKVQSQSVDGL